MVRKSTNPQHKSLGYWVFRINRAMYAEFTSRLAKLGVTSPEWTVLSQCGTRDLTPVELAYYMQIDKAAVTRIISRLEAKSLISRKKHPTDGRSQILLLTPAGKKLLPKLIAASKETNQAFLKLLKSREGKSLLKLLQLLGNRLPPRVFAMAQCSQL